MAHSEPTQYRRKYGRRLKRNVGDVLADVKDEQWDECCRRMALCIGRGSYEAAHKALSEYCARWMPGSITIDSALSELPETDYRMVERLEEAGFDTLRSVVLADDADLLRVREVSRVRLAKLRATIDAFAASDDLPDEDKFEFALDALMENKCSSVRHRRHVASHRGEKT